VKIYICRRNGYFREKELSNFFNDFFEKVLLENKIDVIGITMPVTKWNYQITKPEEIPGAIAKAFYLARTGRPGPVLLDITKDAQMKEFEFEYKKCEMVRGYYPYPKVDEKLIDEAAILLDGAKKPLILAGHGITLAGAEEEFKQFVEKTDIPVATTLLGMAAISEDNPNYVGMLGMHGNYGPNIKTNQADVILAIGMRFDDRVTGNTATYAKQAKIIHVEIDKSEIGKIIKPDVAINADAKDAITSLLGKVRVNKHPEWRKEFDVAFQEEFNTVIKNDTEPDSPKIKMGEVVKMVSDKTNGEALITTDVGQHQMSAARYYEYKDSSEIITSGGLGTMGFGLPAAIGAKVARPEKQSIVFIGDGGFQMTMQELGTIQQFNIPVKIIILNNRYLGMVRQWQERFFDDRYSFVDIMSPDFVNIAKSYDIKGRLVSKREELAGAIDEMLACEEAFLLEIDVEKKDNILPMIEPGLGVGDIKLQ